ncbi:MAG: glycosyltransferase family 2 protein [Deltaproteobacteria bacterium]|nr:glycosyltransferase family 2 protein [Deltaproteobacteria bacterium]
MQQQGDSKESVSIIVPVYGESGMIDSIVARIRATMDGLGVWYEIIVVNDGSHDETQEKAESAGARVISHPYNIGNGAAVKTGIRHARGSVLVMLDGDGQHAPEDIPKLLEKVGPYDMVVGERKGMSQSPLHRTMANTFYNWFASYMCRRKINDLTSGFRAIKRQIARRFLYLLPNGFSYPTTLTMAAVRSGYSLTYVPIQMLRRTGKSKIRIFRDGVRFFLIILKIATLFSPMRVFLPVSCMMFLTGFIYGLFKIIMLDARYGPTSAMLMTISVVVFMVGLVSEQIAQLRFDRSEQVDEPFEDRDGR